MFVLRSTSFQPPCHVYAQIYMLMCYLPCFCLDLHVSAQIYVPMLRSMCLHAPCHACVLRSILVAMPCATLALFAPYYFSFLCRPLLVGCKSRSCMAYIRMPRTILKGLDHFLYISMFACLHLYFISMLASLDLGFAMLCALCGFVLVWLSPSLLGFIWMQPLVRYTSVELVCLI